MSPVSLHHDDIDAWLQDDFLQQSFSYIKEEPPSPPEPIIIDQPLTKISHQVPMTSVSTNANVKQPIILPKIPISRHITAITRPVAPLHGKIVTSAQPKIPLSSTSNSHLLPLNKLPPKLLLKTEQLNTALLPGDKYSIPPKIVKLGKNIALSLFLQKCLEKESSL